MNTQKTSAQPSWLWRFVRSFLYVNCSQWRWARRLHGGKWEEWWADPVNAFVWLPVAEFHADGTRPGGCAIWQRNPAPRAREDYSSAND